MRDSYLEREVPIDVEEEHDDVNEANILGLTDDDIGFQVHNIEMYTMSRNMMTMINTVMANLESIRR
jgi:hypothetical protein